MEMTFDAHDPDTDEIHEAWRDAYRHLAPALIGYLRAQHVDGAEDATVEILGAAAKRIVRLGLDDDALEPWAFVLAHHTLARSRRRSDMPQAGDGLFDDLSTTERDVVLLRLLGDLDVGHVALAVRKRKRSVRSIQRRAIAALASKVSRHPAGTDIPVTDEDVERVFSASTESGNRRLTQLAEVLMLERMAALESPPVWVEDQHVSTLASAVLAD